MYQKFVNILKFYTSKTFRILSFLKHIKIIRASRFNSEKRNFYAFAYVCLKSKKLWDNVSKVHMWKHHLISIMCLCVAASLTIHKRSTYIPHTLTDESYEDEGDEDDEEGNGALENNVLDDTTHNVNTKPSTPEKNLDTTEKIVSIIGENPVERTLTVGRGDTLNSLLMTQGMTHTQAHKVIAALNPVYSARRLQIGQTIQVTLKRDPHIDEVVVQNMAFQPSAYQDIVLVRKDGKYTIQKSKVELDKSLMSIKGYIKDTFFKSAVNQNVPPRVVKKAISALSPEVNMAQVKTGDKFALVYEVFKDKKGHIVKYGNLLYAGVAPGGKLQQVYFFDGPHGPHYYNAKGECAQRGFMGSPLDIQRLRISSGYGPRHHPVRGYTLFHKGIDYSAPYGTRILAAASGVVTKASYWGGFGLYVAIQHGKYTTEYAHMSTIATGIKPGVHVKQGQCIGRVGTTGTSTAPHLHFGLKENGAHINPKSVKMLPSHKLEHKDRVKFVNFQKHIDASVQKVS